MPEPTDSTPPRFEDALASLEEIVRELEEGRVGLDESLAKYEQGVRLLRQCYGLLQSAERKIELLTRIGPGGEAITEPFDDTPSASADAEPAPRSRRRSAKAAKPVVAETPNPITEESIGSLF